MKITIGAVSNFQEFEKELRLIKSSMLYADEIELIGLTEYVVFKYLPSILDSGKPLDLLLEELIPFIQSVELPNKDEVTKQLEYAQEQLKIFTPILEKKKHRTTAEIQAQLKVNLAKKEIQAKLTAAMSKLFNQPSSAELQMLVEKNWVKIFDYQMQDFNASEMAGGYLGSIMNAIYATNTYPLFDEASIGILRPIAQTKLIEFSKLDSEVLRHAGVATRILMTLPTLEGASYDELADFRLQNAGPLSRFRKAVYGYSEKISCLPWDNGFQSECLKMYDTEVAPQVAELNELFTQTSTLKNFGRKVLADEEIRRDAGWAVGGIATAITTSSSLSGFFRQLLVGVSLAIFSKEAAQGFLKTVNLWVQAHDHAKDVRKQGTGNMMYYYYLASKKL